MLLENRDDFLIILSNVLITTYSSFGVQVLRKFTSEKWSAAYSSERDFFSVVVQTHEEKQCFKLAIYTFELEESFKYLVTE